MKIRYLGSFGTLVVCSIRVLAQTPASAVPTDGLELLKRVAQHYADAKSYHIQAVEQYESYNELQRNWQKTMVEAAEVPDNKFYYQGRGGMGTALRVSDGKQVWSYRADQNVYTVKPEAAKDPTKCGS